MLILQAKEGMAADPAIVESVIREIERAVEMVRNVRLETYQPGDVLQCASCGLTFVYRKASSTKVACRRCKATTVERWNANARER